MSQTTLHYKALMRKNWILWKRNICASLCELFCPIALMIILVLARFAVKIDKVDSQSYLNETMIHYPVLDANQAYSNATSVSSLSYIMMEMNRYGSYFNFSDVSFIQGQPYFRFLPVNCIARPDDMEPERPIIAYAPDNSITREIVRQHQAFSQQQRDSIELMKTNGSSQAGFSKYQDTSQFLINYKYQAFDNVDEIQAYLKDPLYMKDEDHPGICFGYAVSDVLNEGYQIDLLFNDHPKEQKAQGVPNQRNPVYQDYIRKTDFTSYHMYEYFGFAFMQNWLANAILRIQSGIPNATITLSTVPLKVDAFTDDSFSMVISNMLPFFMLLMYIMPIYRMIQRILSEKESKAREIIKYSKRLLIFLMFWIYGISLFGLIVFLQSFFQRSRIGAIAGALIYFGTSFINQIITDQQVPESQKNWASLLSTVAVQRGCKNLGLYEQNGVGLDFQNINDLVQNFKFSMCLIMMAISFGVFLTLGLYLDNVLPNNFGLRKPFYYFLTRAYWFGEKRSSVKIDHNSSDIETLDFMELKHIKRQNFEPPSNDLIRQERDQKILKIQELKKTFSNGFQAVKGLNVKMYSGQIFALLGHNGAGKTTTISMLTGLLNSTSGSCEVFGYDLFNEMNSVRHFLGVCPQHDILFDLLTPREHLEIFCDFKGVDTKTKKQEIDQMLKDVDLESSKNTLARDLSGGNRRKLSVAIALIGGSKFVLLDEPTAGLDLTARRKLWNMLKNYKQNRIIILTTHYMDEADILGDRIGIMAGGQLICLGSSLFLKNRFGVGYNVTMVKKYKVPNTKVGEFLQQKLGEVKKLSEVSSEITYQIPTSLSYKFKEFFEEFDINLDKLDITSYGISITTLEEVFLKVGHGEVEEDKDHKEIESSDSIELLKKQNAEMDDYTIAEKQETGIFNVFLIHLGALFRRKFFMSKRNYKGFVVEIFIPVLLVLIGFAFSKIQLFFDSPPRLLDPSLFPLKQRILVNQDLVRKSGPYDIKPQDIIKNLPDYGNSFDPTYKDYSNINISNNNEFALLQQFDQDVFDNRLQGDIEPYRYGSYFIYEANNQTKQFKVATFVNTTSQDVAALYPQFMYEAILKTATGNPNFKFKVYNSPFPISQKLKDRSASANGIFIVFVIGIGFALIPASVISYILYEREKNLKHMQLISGMNLSAYWISNYIFDILKAEIPMGIVIGLMYAFNLNYDGVWVIFLLFPIGVIPFTYVTSFIFSNENIAQTVTIFLHFVFAGIGGIVVFILRIIDSTKEIGDILLWVLKIVPSFCLTNSIMFESSKQTIAILRPDASIDNFNINNLGGDAIVSVAHFVFWTLILIILEGGLLRFLRRKFQLRSSIKPKENLELDQDVVEEERRVAQYVEQNRKALQSSTQMNSDQTMQVCVHKFRKVYTSLFRKPILAVERTSFGLDFGECFALLGVNGAGKTTTFKSLTNEIDPTSGEIYINGKDARNQFSQIRKLIGYCPQHNCIFDMLTVEEHLDFYARIKGILKDQRKKLIEKEIKDMNLEEHRKKPAGTLSGGNQRKLSVAIAVLGNPPIILLDEPSAGMDPQARRFMWSVISKISQQRKQSAVILTTHSMEEAEALSTKMGIMVKGGIFRCFGSSQQIKSKFGTGYEIEVKVKKISPEDLKKLQDMFGLNSGLEMIPLTQAIQAMSSRNINPILVEEIKLGGLGNDIFKESEENKGQINVQNFLTWINIELHGLSIIFGLIEDFNQVEVLEHYNDYYKMRVARQDKSIGYVFGKIESKKDQYGISEYSVSQTTLEQIFQTFANLEIDQGIARIFEKSEQGQVIKRRSSFLANKKNSSKEK